MTSFSDMTDAEMLKMAESWILLEVRRCHRKLALTPTQLMQVMLRVTNKVTEDYLKVLKAEEDETES